MSRKPERKSEGTIMAEQTRQQANTLSPAERQAMLGKALEVIYAGSKKKGGALRR